VGEVLLGYEWILDVPSFRKGSWGRVGRGGRWVWSMVWDRETF
jgi:hypothetical protein